MRIVIATGIYPPRIGGPSFYAQSLEEALKKKGHTVIIVTYGFERHLPTGIRHVVFFLKLLLQTNGADAIIALDTFSVGLPAAWARKMTGVPLIVRTGGDFLWEGYNERTGEKVLFSDFYTKKRLFSFKEKCIFRLTKYVMYMADTVVFSTAYQKDIWMPVYMIPKEKVKQIENYYGEKIATESGLEKVFLGYTRELKWKNIDMLRRIFERVSRAHSNTTLKTGSVSRETFLKNLKDCYAVILVSLGDISPNMILEAVQYGKPVILTKENGLADRLGDTVLYVDPLDEKDIQEKIELLLQPAQYAKYKERIGQFTFVHTYSDIAEEFLVILKEI